MALTVETGSGDATADSLVSLAEARAFATARGKSLPSNDTEAEALIRNAHDYLSAIEARLQGVRTYEVQALPFPRTGVIVNGFLVAKDIIPKQLKNAVCQLVIESQTNPVLPTSDGRVVIQETVGPISTTYSNSGGLNPVASYPSVDAFLDAFLKGGGFSLTTRRV